MGWCWKCNSRFTQVFCCFQCLTASAIHILSLEAGMGFAEEKHHIWVCKSILSCQDKIVQTICTERRFTFPKRSFTLTGEMKTQNTLFLQTKFIFVSQKSPHKDSPHTAHATKERRCFYLVFWLFLIFSFPHKKLLLNTFAAQWWKTQCSPPSQKL